MLDKRHLIQGLDALCRSHTGDFFFDGHKGGALIAVTYLCREMKPDTGVSELLEQRVQKAWGKLPLLAPFPKETPRPELIGRVKEKLVSQCCTLRRAGHNWILTSLALRVLAELPALATPKRLAGLEALIGRFDTSLDLPDKPKIEIPHPKVPKAYAAFVLKEFIASTKRFEGRGQGWSGHLCTFGRALLDLQASGHGDIVDDAKRVLEAYVRRVRSGPWASIDRPRKERPKVEPKIRTLAYWKRTPVNVRLGHAYKYPYAFSGLLAALTDKTLAKEAKDTFWRISGLS